MEPSHTAADLPSATEIMNQEEQMSKTHILYEDDAIVLVSSNTRMTTFIANL